MVPEELFARHSDKTMKAVQPPTEVLKELFHRRETEVAAADVLLPQNEVSCCRTYLDFCSCCDFFLLFLSEGIHVVPTSSNCPG